MNATNNDNRFEMIDRAKKDLLENTNIETSPEEMKILDNILFGCYQMGWLEKYSERTESREGQENKNKKDDATDYRLLLKHLKEIEISQSLIINAILTAFVIISDKKDELKLSDGENSLISHGIIAMQAALEHIEIISGMKETVDKFASKIKIFEGDDVFNFLKEILK